MITFDLDGTLANCEHRRHFVDPEKNPEYSFMKGDMMTRLSDGYYKPREGTSGFIKFKPDWKSFYEACDKDSPIEQVITLFKKLWDSYEVPIQIWSGRCESVRYNTHSWLLDQGLPVGSLIKMRPIGDNTPDDQLKEKWLDEALAQGKKIEMVFDDRPKVVRMWRRRGIFVFDCNQNNSGDF